MNYFSNDITAENAEPRSDYDSLTSALSCGIAEGSLTCVVGEHYPLNNSYLRMRSVFIILFSFDNNI